jgi:hypothetical protein
MMVMAVTVPHWIVQAVRRRASGEHHSQYYERVIEKILIHVQFPSSRRSNELKFNGRSRSEHTTLPEQIAGQMNLNYC